MADLAFGISKGALQSLAAKVRSAIKEEAEQWQIVQRDLVFIKGEFEMMQAFLDIGDAQHVKNSVGRTWVSQVHDLSYDTEDWMEFVLHLKPKKWGWLHRMRSICTEGAAQPLDVAVEEIKNLKARVEDVSKRNLRYNLISDSGSNPVAQMEQTVAGSKRALDIFVKARETEKNSEAVTQLKSFISADYWDLNVVSVCGIGCDLGTTSIVWQVYEDSYICSKFKLRAWLQLDEYKQSSEDELITKQFLANLKDDATIEYIQKAKKETPKKETTYIPTEYRRFNEFPQEIENTYFDNWRLLPDLCAMHRFLIVVEGAPSRAQWDSIKRTLPATKNGSRIIVLTKRLEIASLCTGPPYKVSMIREFSAGHSVYVFFKEAGPQNSQGNERDSVDYKKADELEDYIEAARGKDKASVIFIWGKNGTGNPDLVRNVYNRLSFNKMFDLYAWVHEMHHFDMEDLCNRLLSMLCPEKCKGIINSVIECRKLLHKHRCFVVIEGLEAEHQWNSIMDSMILGTSRSFIVVITSEHEVARRCARSVNGTDLYFFQEEGFQYGYAMQTGGRPPLPEMATNWIDTFRLHGRDSAVREIKERIVSADSVLEHHVFSVWGLPGVGKTALVRKVYYTCVVDGLFEKFSWVNASPMDKEFDIDGFCQQLYSDLCPGMKYCDPRSSITQLLEHSCLVVIDGLESEIQWDSILVLLTTYNLGPLSPLHGTRSCILVITRSESIARHCAHDDALFRIDALEAVANPLLSLTEVHFRSLNFPGTSKVIPRNCAASRNFNF